LFTIDFALIFKDCKFAIEICGTFYGHDDVMNGKKKNKFEILQNDGWRVIKVSTRDISEKLAFQKGPKVNNTK
jgi:very-short-patch-repair endonuclease